MTFGECRVHVSCTMIEMIFVQVLCEIVMICELAESRVYFIVLVLSFLNTHYLYMNLRDLHLYSNMLVTREY